MLRIDHPADVQCEPMRPSSRSPRRDRICDTSGRTISFGGTSLGARQQSFAFGAA